MRQLARISAQALGVERVGVWMFEDEARRLRNLSQYALVDPTATAGEVLDVSGLPGLHRPPCASGGCWRSRTLGPTR